MSAAYEYQAGSPDGLWSKDEVAKLLKGMVLVRNGKRYAFCRDCRTIVRIDKPFVGSLHLCA